MPPHHPNVSPNLWYVLIQIRGGGRAAVWSDRKAESVFCISAVAFCSGCHDECCSGFSAGSQLEQMHVRSNLKRFRFTWGCCVTFYQHQILSHFTFFLVDVNTINSTLFWVLKWLVIENVRKAGVLLFPLDRLFFRHLLSALWWRLKVSTTFPYISKILVNKTHLFKSGAVSSLHEFL